MKVGIIGLSMKDLSALKDVDNGQRVALLSGTIAVVNTAKAVMPSVLVQSILSTVSNILHHKSKLFLDDFRLHGILISLYRIP